VADLLKRYPCLFSLAFSNNSFDANASPIVRPFRARAERTCHLSYREYGQDSHENDDEKQKDKWYRQRAVGRLNVSAPIRRLEKGGSCKKEKHERNRRKRANYHNRFGWGDRQRVHQGDCYAGE
jgi:hypothetical protein